MQSYIDAFEEYLCQNKNNRINSISTMIRINNINLYVLKMDVKKGRFPELKKHFDDKANPLSPNYDARYVDWDKSHNEILANENIDLIDQFLSKNPNLTVKDICLNYKEILDSQDSEIKKETLKRIHFAVINARQGKSSILIDLLNQKADPANPDYNPKYKYWDKPFDEHRAEEVITLIDNYLNKHPKMKLKDIPLSSKSIRQDETLYKLTNPQASLWGCR